MVRATLAAFAAWVLLLSYPVSAASLLIDGSQSYQTIDGFGVNANHRAFDDSLKPVIDSLIDDAGMTLFRVVYDNADWEQANDNSSANAINWSYYSNIYTSPEFQKLWGLMAYLNEKGITNGVMPNVQGFAPGWMGYQNLTRGKEAEWAEMIGSLLVYARYSNHLAFSIAGPNNEPDLPGSGIGIASGTQYTLTLHKLGQVLDRNGMSDLRFVGPDRSQSDTNWLPDLLKDSYVMGKIAHIGLHSYADNGGGSWGVDDFLRRSAYPDLNFWMTEFNVWCNPCQDSISGTNSWEYARDSARYLLNHLADNAAAGLVWDGYDAQYLHNYDDQPFWSYWGLFAVDDTNAAIKTYTPRKTYYTLSQISKFVRPGAKRIALQSDDPTLSLLAFRHPATEVLTIVGINPNDTETTLSGVITNVTDVASLDLYYTDASNNRLHAGSVDIVDGAFSIVVPANCVFTLVSPTVPAPVVTVATSGAGSVYPDPATQTFLRGSNYTFIAIPSPGYAFAGWSGAVESSSAEISVPVGIDLALQANFAPGTFTPKQAVYRGLFQESAGFSSTHSGAITLTTTSGGAFSGKLQMASGTYSFSGRLNAEGHGQASIRRRGANHLNLDFQIDLTPEENSLTGVIGDGSFAAGMLAQAAPYDGKSTKADQAGRYTFALAGASDAVIMPGGNSYGTITVSTSGQVRVAWFFADGEKAAQSTTLSGSGEFPAFASLGRRGFAAGWMQFTNAPDTDLTGLISWNKTRSLHDKYYPGGFQFSAPVIGSRYVAPSRGGVVVDISSPRLALTGDAIPGDVSEGITLTPPNRFTGVGTTVTVSLGNGLLKGVALPGGPNPRINFTGAILQKQSIGTGYFLNDGESGVAGISEAQ
ncbi:MAG TPA: hypothetical protein VHH88_12600 [Verrucomicrobiae bacterium]|nr:hypothetical protein [Verrucomicrobiae bacterium]